MPQFEKDGRVIYDKDEEILTSEQLLARGTVIVNPGFGFEKKPKATDLSPVKPVRNYDAESNAIVQRLAMDYPLNKLPEVRTSMPFLTPML